MSQLTLPQAIDRLNRYSRIKWGDKAPQYSFTWKGNPRTYYVHRINAQVSPFIPADELFARGPREHCLARVESAIRHACR